MHKVINISIVDGASKDGSIKTLNFAKKYLNGIIIVKNNTGLSKQLHTPILSFYSIFNWSDTTQGYRGYNNIIFKDKRISIFRNIFEKYELLAYLNYILPLTTYSCIQILTFRKYNKINKLNSKIKGFSSNLEIITVLFKACWKHFNKKR